MPKDKEIRKLAAIMHADVKGYSRLMGEDELFTVRTLKESREIFSKNIQMHGGRIVNAPGNSVLAEFPSVVAAVKSAVLIQDQLNVKNADLNEKDRGVLQNSLKMVSGDGSFGFGNTPGGLRLSPRGTLKTRGSMNWAAISLASAYTSWIRS